jgi:transcriptional regulator with XRE-family HTH domain
MDDGGDTDPKRGLDPDAALGAAIRLLRERAGLTQAALAARVEIAPASISAIEAGQEEPTWGSLRRIASGVEVPLADLFSLEERLEDGRTS